MTKLIKNILLLLYHPRSVLVLCIIFGATSLLFSGNIFRLFQLRNDRTLISNQMEKLTKQISDFNTQLKFAKDPAFIERQALDLYDMVEEHDLVFVFSDE